jgi:hypothetical protein
VAEGQASGTEAHPQAVAQALAEDQALAQAAAQALAQAVAQAQALAQADPEAVAETLAEDQTVAQATAQAVAQGLAKGAARAQAAATGVILPGRGASLAPLRGPPGSRARSSEPCFRGRGETPAHPRSSVGPLTAIRLPHGPKTHDRMRDCERREHPGACKDHRDPKLGTASQPGLHIRDVTNLRAIKPRTRTPGLSESLSARQSGGVNLRPSTHNQQSCAGVCNRIRNALECARGFSAQRLPSSKYAQMLDVERWNPDGLMRWNVLE